jgi:hypothetical protein
MKNPRYLGTWNLRKETDTTLDHHNSSQLGMHSPRYTKKSFEKNKNKNL